MKFQSGGTVEKIIRRAILRLKLENKALYYSKGGKWLSLHLLDEAS